MHLPHTVRKHHCAADTVTVAAVPVHIYFPTKRTKYRVILTHGSKSHAYICVVFMGLVANTYSTIQAISKK